MTNVAAALIIQKGKFLICQRPPHKARGGLWEFVGGKLEPGESGEEALIRECREELDILVQPEDVYMVVDHVYPDITIRLTLYKASIISGEPRLLEHTAITYISPSETEMYAFCPADTEILKRIRQDYERGCWEQ